MQLNDSTIPLEQVSREAFWQQHLDRCQVSSLSKMAYCRQHDLAYHQMIYWQKRLDVPADSHTEQKESERNQFVPVIVDNEDSQTPALSLTLPNGLVVSGITDSTVGLIKPLLSQL